MTRSVLVVGSGPIVIGQAAEFDYSGTQSCLTCREEGVRTILVNSNPATIQTDPQVADVVYIEPLTLESLRQIIEIERPDGMIATMGGQTGLNLSVGLAEAGVLDRYGVEILGTDLQAIRRGEDRALFAETLKLAGQPVLPSEAVTTVEEALRVAEHIGYPVMCRSAYALGGAGSGFATQADELRRQVQAGLRSSGSGQVLVEKSVRGWNEVEYEVLRDARDNCLIVCNMENIDPMGVHTGESIVVAPSQTLTDVDYHRLRAAAMAVVRALDVRGACNVQFALDRESGRYFVIEVNPRLSRSSALASKATGYPIARVATRIALGYALPEITNSITGTSAFFEPALDYVTIKIPRWPFDKFTQIPAGISTSMRSTGEVMAIGRTFEEAMRKAMRSLDQRDAPPREDLRDLIETPNAHRLFAIVQAIECGWEPEEIARLSGIHPWFVQRLADMVHAPVEARTVFKMVDTCAAEFEARTPYFYSTAQPGASDETTHLPGPKAIILGAGPIRIGQGVEFDYSTVHACHALRTAGIRSVIINNNPETVSTDYTTSDRLYFEPLDLEAVMAVVRCEADGLLGVIPQFGGQTAIHLVQGLQDAGVRILGTPPESIDAAEDRARTSEVLESSGIPAPAWTSVEHWQDLSAAVERLGYPALLRPSYVLSGQGMMIVRGRDDVRRYLDQHSRVPLRKPLLIDSFLEGAIELNVDAVSDGDGVLTVIMEQLEECGVHSGDSVDVYPTQTIDATIVNTVREYTQRLAQAFSIVGLMNVQYAVHQGTVYVLEVNPRASRSVPFASKASGVPLADIGVRAILGERLRDMGAPEPRTDRISVKQVVLPFRIFPQLPPLLGPEMQSTGESMGSGRTFAEAYWKAWLGAGMKRLPFGGRVWVSIPGNAGVDRGVVLEHLRDSGCIPVTPQEQMDLSTVTLVVALGRTDADLAVLQRAVTLGVPCITTEGGTRGLLRALQGGRPDLWAEALPGTTAEVLGPNSQVQYDRSAP